MQNFYSVIKTELEQHTDEHAHGDFSLESLFEVMFGLDHVISEVFWNMIFVLIGFAVSKAVALRKIHKYIDDKHGVTHQKDEY